MIRPWRSGLALAVLVGVPAGCGAALVFAFAEHLHRLGVLL